MIKQDHVLIEKGHIWTENLWILLNIEADQLRPENSKGVCSLTFYQMAMKLKGNVVLVKVD